MSNKSEIISALLDCGSADVDFIDRELDSFNVGAHDVVEHMRDRICEELHVNEFIQSIYRVALANAIVDANADEERINDENISIYTNCIDSHLFVKDKDGLWVEVYEYDELVECLRDNYKTEE
ncbi:hypothetical protein [Alistipes sp.]|uniref:hypothetical protein n=1 Tax=Alistipes sp. TaxID=1872444 RepID=UPI0035273F8F